MVRFFSAFAPGLFTGGLVSAASSVAAWAKQSSPRDAAACASRSSTFTPDEFRPFKLLSSRYESHDTRRLYFALESGEAVFSVPVSSCIVAKLTDAEGKDLLKPFTPITANNKKGHFELIVKRHSKDKMSALLFQLQPGEELLVKGPFEKFTYKPNMWKHVGMLAGGTGIAPMYQLLQAILMNAKDRTHVSLVYANNQRRDILLANELTTLNKTYNNFNLYLTLLEVPHRWLGGIGYINEAMIRTFMPKPGERHTKILVAGPPSMLAEVAGDKVFAGGKAPEQGPLLGLLKRMGYTEEQVFKY
ncbi:putative NADH-cytochrome b5 reductase [Trypanosoma cruzi]|uniref:cytochrome-b5 reductase n=1 Tax=Trypanosoma cruzi TaxID=5693 RepID=A0A2V2W7T5_TRYCR|nr:NADH-cytochrome b5 reductase [Trypanosoma cruzi]KAF8288420.1 putative NADH-cytochrome b5 reductase [Trypanosoma cruzi]PWV04648.1 putative NADH-cytochrome b5 reductase [Trypanosoma cruzi]RNC34183.1 NADH-cytochrome b5 reductase [Trypanosoma cruzi]